MKFVLHSVKKIFCKIKDVNGDETNHLRYLIVKFIMSKPVVV